MADQIIRTGDHVRWLSPGDTGEGLTGWVNSRPAPGLANLVLDADNWDQNPSITNVPTSELEKI